MPSAWQENFVHANMRIANVTLAQMTDYLASEQIIADTKRDRANGGRGHGGRSTSNVRSTAPGRGRGYQGRGYQGRGRSSGYKRHVYNDANRNNSRNAAINDPCCYHGNAHTWKMCYGNPDGPNYRPGFQPRPQGNTGRGHGNGGRFQPGHGNGSGCSNDAYQNDTASNAGHSTAVSASSTIANNVPAVPLGRRWTASPDVNGRVPTYRPNPSQADNHWIDSVGSTEDE
eukprot:scaffold75838_cov48-Attheya_sp.AAC.3